MDKRVLPPPLVEVSRRLRNEATPAERILWRYLREKQLDGFKFRRQFVIEPYIVDFYCHPARLVIELDGNIHDDPEVQARDIDRQQWLEAQGFRVLRFQNRDVLHNIEGVIETIRSHLSGHEDEEGT
jgi:very-short-patch-repair endonuclease